MISTPVVVLWSGGYDSTLSLLRYIRSGRNVIALSISSEATGGVKLRCEKDSRSKIKQYLSTFGKMYGASVEYLEYTLAPVAYEDFSMINFDNAYVRADGYMGGSKVFTRQRIVQPVLWLSGLYAVSPYLPENCDIAFSYISSDSSLAYRNYISSAVENMGKIQGKNFKFVTPLLMSDKEDVLMELHTEYPEVFEYCYSCENLYHEGPCSNCHPCLNIIRAVSGILLQHISDEDRDFWTKFLRDKYRVVLERIYEGSKEESKYDGSD